MHTRAAQLIRELGLQPHPEGGHYLEVYRSEAVTTIYFLLAEGEISRWHRITSEELWHHYEGAPLDLWQLTPDGSDLAHVILGPIADGTRPIHRVPNNYWQAARSAGDFTLVGCTVAPAFRFADFCLLKDTPALAAAVIRNHPSMSNFV